MTVFIHVFIHKSILFFFLSFVHFKYLNLLLSHFILLGIIIILTFI